MKKISKEDTLTLKEMDKAVKRLLKNKVPFRDVMALLAFKIGTTIKYKKGKEE